MLKQINYFLTIGAPTMGNIFLFFYSFKFSFFFLSLIRSTPGHKVLHNLNGARNTVSEWMKLIHHVGPKLQTDIFLVEVPPQKLEMQSRQLAKGDMITGLLRQIRM